MSSIKQRLEKHRSEEKSVDVCYSLRLYITGATPNSLRAISNIKAICEKYLASNYNLEIIDIYKQQEKAHEDQIVALPMLLKIKPAPHRRLIGDLSDTIKVLEALDIKG